MSAHIRGEFYCSSPRCLGYTWKASESPHPHDLCSELPPLSEDEAIELTLLFHDGGVWDDYRKERWATLTGGGEVQFGKEATTRVLCDELRSVFYRRGSPRNPDPNGGD